MMSRLLVHLTRRIHDGVTAAVVAAYKHMCRAGLTSSLRLRVARFPKDRLQANAVLGKMLQGSSLRGPQGVQ